MSYHPREALTPVTMPRASRARLAITAGRARLARIVVGNVAITVAVIETLHALGLT